MQHGSEEIFEVFPLKAYLWKFYLCCHDKETGFLSKSKSGIKSNMKDFFFANPFAATPRLYKVRVHNLWIEIQKKKIHFVCVCVCVIQTFVIFF
jgi:hypothetical protein